MRPDNQTPEEKAAADTHEGWKRARSYAIQAFGKTNDLVDAIFRRCFTAVALGTVEVASQTLVLRMLWKFKKPLTAARRLGGDDARQHLGGVVRASSWP